MPTSEAKIYEDEVLRRMRENIVGINTDIPLLDGTKRPYVYFDNAASTPVLKEVLDCINGFIPWYSSVHRGSGLKSQVATQAYEDAREIERPRRYLW